MAGIGPLRVAISRGALVANARPADPDVIADLRRDAYGHGVAIVAQALAEAGVRAAVVDDAGRAALAAAGLQATDAAPTLDSRTLYGLPGGMQFPVLVETLISASQPGAALDRDVASKLKKLREPVQISVFVTPVCQYSAPVAAAAFRLALASAHVKAEVVEISEYPELVQRFGVTATPTTVIDARTAIRGALDEAALAAHVVAGAEPYAALRTVDAGPYSPFDGETIERQAAASRPGATQHSAGPRIYVPGR